MENASKALIIAGAILLAILLISLGIIVFSGARTTIIDNSDMSQQEITTFNNKFTPYEGERVRGSQVNALAQAVLSNNQSAKNNGETETKGITMNGKVNINSDGTSTSFTRLPAGTFYSVKFTYKNSLVNEIVVGDVGTGSGSSATPGQ